MNHEAVLGLIADLYAQIRALSAQNEHLIAAAQKAAAAQSGKASKHHA